jgi:hypothetical protein
MAALLLTQTPAGVLLLSAVVAPTQTVLAPVIGPTTGNAFTVTTAVCEVAQPLALVTVYVIVTVPAATPVTSPVLLTAATAASLLVHTPPGVVLLKAVTAPTHTAISPVMGFTTGVALTVTVAVCAALQLSLFVTV